MRVDDILGRKDIRGVATIGRHEAITALAAMLAEKRLGALVVTDDAGAMCGVISERDIVRALATRGEAALGDPVERHMTSEVVTAAPEDSAVSVLEKMTRGRFRHMPVITDGKLVGVVSIGDLVKARIDALEREKDAMEAFIQG